MKKVPVEVEIISLRQACRRAGITVPTAVKLGPEEFPAHFWLGKKRVVARRQFEQWLNDKIGEGP